MAGYILVWMFDKAIDEINHKVYDNFASLMREQFVEGLHWYSLETKGIDECERWRNLRFFGANRCEQVNEMIVEVAFLYKHSERWREMRCCDFLA